MPADFVIRTGDMLKITMPPPEIYPTRMRAIGTGLATSWLRLASAAAPTIVGLMVGEQGVAAVFLMFAGVAVVGMIAAMRMIETSNRRLEEIAQ